MAKDPWHVILGVVPLSDAAARMHQAYNVVLATRNLAPLSTTVRAPNPSKEVVECLPSSARR